MKGSIDQVEAFFAGISSAWAKALVFLGSVSLGHLLGLFASDFAWVEGELHSGFELILVPSAPLTWMWAFVTSFLVPWQGLLLMIVIGAAFYLLVYTEVPRLPITCIVAIVQAWITYAVFRPMLERPDPYAAVFWQRDPPQITWLGTPFLIVATVCLGYLGYRFWKRAQEQ
jgi:hypothetical protein